MADHILNIADTIKEIRDIETVAEADKTSALLVRAVRAALNPLEKWVLLKEYNLASTKKILEEKLAHISVDNITEPPLNVAVPALHGISYCMDNDQIRGMYAELLAHAMNSETVDEVHPAFVEIIRQMSSYDAVVFKRLVRSSLHPCVIVKYINTVITVPNYKIIAFKDVPQYPLPQTQMSIQNLERLRLINVGEEEKECDAFNCLLDNFEGSQIEYKTEIERFINGSGSNGDSSDLDRLHAVWGTVMITEFGRAFARICLG